MRGLVVDASVMAAFVFVEPRFRPAERLLTGRDLIAPTLLRYELASVGARKAREDPDLRDLIDAGFSVLARLSIRWIAPDPADLVDLSARTGLTTYDASYLWAARSTGSDLATFDRRLAVAARRSEGDGRNR
jgi:predicted nucleic acid-binding protein